MIGTSVPLELQRLFFEMELAAANGIPSVGTEKLTKSFGSLRELDVARKPHLLGGLAFGPMRPAGLPSMHWPRVLARTGLSAKENVACLCGLFVCPVSRCWVATLTRCGLRPGWGPREVNEQQDVSEFWQMLYQLLRDAGGEVQRERLERIFEGRTLNYVRCTRVDFKREREERFTDLQMQVSGCSSLMDSFRHFVAEEKLDGANRYRTPEHGRQDARKGARFTQLPPVLQLHLKRFEYDAATGMMQKLQQAFTFPTTLRLRSFLAKGAADGRPAPVYRLYAVLSHAGDVGSGHYVAYVRPLGSDQWYEFDDTRVRKVPEEAAVKAQYGGEYSRNKKGFFNMGAPPNAYMLTYVRENTVRECKAAGSQSPGAGLPASVLRRFEVHAKGKHASKRSRTVAMPSQMQTNTAAASLIFEDDDEDLLTL